MRDKEGGKRSVEGQEEAGEGQEKKHPQQVRELLVGDLRVLGMEPEL